MDSPGSFLVWVDKGEGRLQRLRMHVYVCRWGGTTVGMWYYSMYMYHVPCMSPGAGAKNRSLWKPFLSFLLIAFCDPQHAAEPFPLRLTLPSSHPWRVRVMMPKKKKKKHYTP